MAILLSIIIPVYNIENYLERCVESILNQNIDNYEILLINDGSLDKSDRICDDLEKKYNNIKTIHKENAGVNTARNQGLDFAKGEYITFIDGDDYIEPDTFKYNLRVLKQNPDIDILQYPEFIVKNNNKKLRDNYPSELIILHEKYTKIKFLIDENKILPGEIWGKIYKRKIWDKVRLREDMQFCEDAYTIINLLDSNYVIGISPYGGYNYIVREGSACSSKFTPKKSRDYTIFKYEFFKKAYKYKIHTDNYWEEAVQAIIDTLILGNKDKEILDIIKNLKKYKSKSSNKTKFRILLNSSQIIIKLKVIYKNVKKLLRNNE